jgi:cytochrome c oxidase assembly protein subunit 15
MREAFLPPGAFASGLNWVTLTEDPVSVHWIHRWLAFAVIVAIALLAAGFRRHRVSVAAQRAATAALVLTGIQVLLGITLLLWRLPVAVALLHQAVGFAVFVTLIVANHRVLRD